MVSNLLQFQRKQNQIISKFIYIINLTNLYSFFTIVQFNFLQKTNFVLLDYHYQQHNWYSFIYLYYYYNFYLKFPIWQLRFFLILINKMLSYTKLWHYKYLINYPNLTDLLVNNLFLKSILYYNTILISQCVNDSFNLFMYKLTKLLYLIKIVATIFYKQQHLKYLQFFKIFSNFNHFQLCFYLKHLNTFLLIYRNFLMQFLLKWPKQYFLQISLVNYIKNYMI